MRALVNYQTNPSQRAIVFCVNKCWLLLATLIITTAVIFTLLRVFLPEINYFKSDIENWIETNYQLDIEVGRIDAKWGETGPIVSLSNFRLRPKNEQINLVEVESLLLHVDGLTSLLSGRLTTKNIEIRGANLNFILDRKLGVRLERPDDSINAEIQSTSQLVLNNLFSQKNLTLIQSNISLETLNGRQFNYWIRRLDIANFDETHQLTGLLENEFGGQLKLVAEIFGEPWEPESYSNLYLEGRNLALSHLPGYEKFPQLKPESGAINLRLWGDWRDGRWQTAVGDINVKDVQWGHSNSATEQAQKTTDAKPGQSIESLTMDFKWQFDNERSGTLVFHDSKLKKKNKPEHQLPAFYLLFDQSSPKNSRWDVVISDFQIEPLVSYVALPLESDSTMSRFCTEAGLELLIETFGARLMQQNGVWKSPTLYAKFDDLAFDKSQPFPYVSGVSGELQLVDGKGNVRLNGQDAVVSIQPLFRNELAFDEIAAEVFWSFDSDNNLSLLVDSAKFKNSDLSINARSKFFVQDGEPNLSLFAELTDVNVSQKSLYLPAGIMSSGLTEYLDTGVLSGRLSSVRAAVRGPLKAFPFEREEGLFAILGGLENATYQYLPDWPVATALNAKLLFEGNGMDIRASSGVSKKIELNEARAIIQDFSAPNTPFELYIDANNSGNRGRSFLLDTPLKDIGESINSLDYRGDARVRLGINLGLDDSSNIIVNGSVEPDESNASLTFNGLKFTQLNGKLLINEKGIKQSQLKAFYYDNPIVADLVGGQSADQAKLELDLKGKVTAQSLSDYLGESYGQFLKGETSIDTRVLISPPGAEDLVTVNIDSNLDGLAVALPDQFSKVSEDKTPLSLKLNVTETFNIELAWKAFKAKWWWRQDDSEYQHIGGTFLFDSQRELPNKLRKNYSTHFNLKEFTLNEWLEVFEKYQRLEEKKNDSLVLPDFEIAMNVGDIKNDFVEVKQLAVLAEKKHEAQWRFFAEGAIGKVALTLSDSEPWRLDVKDLNLNTLSWLESKAAESNAEDSKKNASKKEENSTEERTQVTENMMNPEEVQRGQSDQNTSPLSRAKEQAELAAGIEPEIDNSDVISFPENWPSIVMQCSQCQINGVDLGDIQAKTSSEKNSVTLAGNLNYRDKDRLHFNLEWLNLSSIESEENNLADSTKTTPRYLTKLGFNLAADDVGQLMKRLDYPVVVKESNGRFVGKLWWQDAPSEFDPLQAKGLAYFRLGEGYLSEVSDAKARLFSVLSLQTLSRRLQLDFKDVYKKGFFYDKLTGAISLSDSLLESHNVYLDGSAAKVRLDGAINLEEQSIEQHALVLPQLTSSLPVLVGWAVEPTTGILVFLLNKIFEPAIEVVTQIEYRIHGSLEDIKVDEVKRSESSVKYTVPEQESSPPAQKTTDVESKKIPSGVLP